MPRLFTVLLFWLGLASAVAAQPARTERIEAELVPMSQWAAPGSTAIVAVRQSIEPGWHTYWRNPGDSGGATTLNWTLPVGVRAGDILWPLPERQRLLGLMNYGYSGEVFLPVPIEVPADARPGSTILLSTRALFLVCSAEMCVPDELTLTLALPIRDGAAPPATRHGAAIQRTVEAAPRPGALQARIAMAGSGPDAGLTLSVAGEALAGRTPTAVYFFPYNGGVIAHPAEQPGAYGPQGLTLELTPGGEVQASGLTGPVQGVLSTSLGAWEINADPGPSLPGTTGSGALTSAPAGGDWTVFLQALGFALIGGLILNLMPCVFPVLAMKAASLARSAHDPREARRDGLAFLAGVLTSFFLLAGVLIALRSGGQAVGWGFHLQSPAVTAGLALLILAVGLNLSSVFHIGGGVQGLGSGPLARLPGGLGAFFTGVLAVVVAAPCTAPFMAFALGAALTMPAAMALGVFLALGLGLALPYVLVSLSPGLLARLPRPGPWMVRLKELLAFPMYAAALWLVWVFARQTGAEALALLLAAGLSLALGLYLWGRRQADAIEGRGGRTAAIAAILSIGLAVALTVVAVRLPVQTAQAETSSALPSAPWSPQAVAAAQSQGRPVFVNFTADWCVTCKINERASLTSSEATEAFERSGAVYLVGDWTRRDPAIAAELQRHGRSGVPLYLVYAPGSPQPRILPQLLTPGLVAEALLEAGA